MNETKNFDIRSIDAEYKSFPDFSEWGKIVVDTNRWERQRKRIDAINDKSPDMLRAAEKVIRRFAAVETGSIEELYPADRGKTISIALETAEIESLFSTDEQDTVEYIKSQLNGYEYILDFATGQTEFAEAWLRELHEIICKSQEFYIGYVGDKTQKQKLKKGVYKQTSNHVLLPDGSYHSYCPPEMVGPEIHRMISQINSDEFESAHPIVQAAYVHYSVVCIHPFTDGNGRIARALASIFLYRHYSIPLFILADDRIEYLDTLKMTDEGDLTSLVEFIIDRCFNAIDWIEISIRLSNTSKINDTLEKFSLFYTTKSGLKHEQVDIAAINLMKSFYSKLKNHFDSLRIDGVLERKNLNFQENAKYGVADPNYRLKLNDRGISITISMISKPPANSNVSYRFYIYIPKHCDPRDNFIISMENTNREITARINEIFPSIKETTLHKLDMQAELIINEMFKLLYNQAKTVYKP